MAKVKTIINSHIAQTLNTAEIVFSVSTSTQNATIDWEERNYNGSTLEIYTATGSGGTKLSSATDYTVTGINDYLTEKTGVQIYKELKIINATYLNTNLYIPISTLGVYGDFVDETDLNRMQTQIDSVVTPTRDVYDISTGTNSVHPLPDATTTTVDQVIKRRGAGTGKVTFTTVSSQTIEGLAASIWELEGEGEIVLFPYSGNWEVKYYTDYIVGSNNTITKELDGSMREIGEDPIVIVSSTNGSTTITYDKAFISTPKILTGAGSIIGFSYFNSFPKTITATQCELIAIAENDNSGSGTINVTWETIGRWRT